RGREPAQAALVSRRDGPRRPSPLCRVPRCRISQTSAGGDSSLSPDARSSAAARRLPRPEPIVAANRRAGEPPTGLGPRGAPVAELRRSAAGPEGTRRWLIAPRLRAVPKHLRLPRKWEEVLSFGGYTWATTCCSAVR